MSGCGKRRATSKPPDDRRALLVLDLDGPILDVSARYYAAHLDALAAVDDPGLPLDAQELWRLKRRRGEIRELLADGDKDAEYLDFFRAAVERDELLVLDRLQPGALDAVVALAEIFEVRVLSLRTNQAGARACVERLGVSGLVPVEFIPHGSEGKATRVAQIAGSFADVIVVGDTEADAAAAQRIAAPFIGVRCGIREDRLLYAAGAAAVVADLQALVLAIEEDAGAVSKLGRSR